MGPAGLRKSLDPAALRTPLGPVGWKTVVGPGSKGQLYNTIQYNNFI